jgi:hypothetical protein
MLPVSTDASFASEEPFSLFLRCCYCRRQKKPMKFNPNGSIVTATYALLLLLALETLSGVRTGSVSTVKFGERIVLWTVIVLVTAASITYMIRRRRFEPLGLDVAFREMERWADGIVQGWRRLHRQ